ncbi:MAG: diphosphomevalonate decarboxylase [Deltaproteobacteria bacterium]|nr:MAG: diphosphomevalonate decarboxylase [Deltaproteobacteria bacterium]
MTAATARAHPNIALVKYWGKRDLRLNLPAVPSLSVTLDRFETVTTVIRGTGQDRVVIDDAEAVGRARTRVLRILDLMDPARPPCHVISRNNFPAAAGLASSSSAFAALVLAADVAADQCRSPEQLSVLARRGSGSACRSLWGGFVEWSVGRLRDGSDSHGHPIADPGHWDLRIVVAVVSDARKPVGSTEGMIRTQETSPLFPAFVDQAPARVARARQAILDRDLAALGEEMERSTWEMHATMLTAWPTIRYQQPGTLACLDAVVALRGRGISAWATMDAGPNVKVLCAAADADEVAAALRPHAPRVEVLGIGRDPTVELHR